MKSTLKLFSLCVLTAGILGGCEQSSDNSTEASTSGMRNEALPSKAIRFRQRFTLGDDGSTHAIGIAYRFAPKYLSSLTEEELRAINGSGKTTVDVLAFNVSLGLQKQCESQVVSVEESASSSCSDNETQAHSQLISSLNNTRLLPYTQAVQVLNELAGQQGTTDPLPSGMAKITIAARDILLLEYGASSFAHNIFCVPVAGAEKEIGPDCST